MRTILTLAAALAILGMAGVPAKAAVSADTHAVSTPAQKATGAQPNTKRPASRTQTRQRPPSDWLRRLTVRKAAPKVAKRPASWRLSHLSRKPAAASTSKARKPIRKAIRQPAKPRPNQADAVMLQATKA